MNGCRAANPAPRTELHYGSPFELLIAVMLSAQATDKSVNKATRGVVRGGEHPGRHARLGSHGLTPYIRSIGLYNSKAKHIIATCKALVTQHAGQVPHGARSVGSAAGRRAKDRQRGAQHGVSAQPTIAVDTHIFRVANRTGLAPGTTVRAVEDKLMKLVPPEYLQGCASLADPARPLRVQGAQPRMAALPHRRSVRVSAQDEGSHVRRKARTLMRTLQDITTKSEPPSAATPVSARP